MPEAVFYSYAYPAPEGFAEARVQPADASWNTTLRKFVLPYEKMRQAEDPDRMLLEFFADNLRSRRTAGKMGSRRS